MSTPANSPTDIRPKKRPLWKRWWIWAIAVIVALVAAFAVWVAIDVVRINTLDAAAIEECTEAVGEQAKYPGGVTFVDEPSVSQDKIVTNNRGNEVITMGGRVDFPNGFGTPVRGSYMCMSEVSDNQVIQTRAIVSGFGDD